MCENDSFTDAGLGLQESIGEAGGWKSGLEDGDVVNGAGESHGDAGDHCGTDIDGNVKDTEQASDNSDGEDVGHE